MFRMVFCLFAAMAIAFFTPSASRAFDFEQILFFGSPTMPEADINYLTNTYDPDFTTTFERAQENDIASQIEMAKYYTVFKNRKYLKPASREKLRAYWTMRAAKNGDLSSMVNLAELLINGKGVRKNEDLAIALWEFAIDSGHSEEIAAYQNYRKAVAQRASDEKEAAERQRYLEARAPEAREIVEVVNLAVLRKICNSQNYLKQMVDTGQVLNSMAAAQPDSIKIEDGFCKIAFFASNGTLHVNKIDGWRCREIAQGHSCHFRFYLFARDSISKRTASNELLYEPSVLNEYLQRVGQPATGVFFARDGHYRMKNFQILGQ